jgi:uncharacterized protein (TIGR00251 family)
MRLNVHVTPRSSRNEVIVRDGVLRVRVTAPPVDGAANAAIQEVLAEWLDLPKRAIRIVRGESGRNKTIDIITADEASLRARLAALGHRG